MSKCKIKSYRAPTVRPLTNKIVLARKEHTLQCGCLVKPGMYYHSLTALVNGRFNYIKNHALGCLETIKAVH